jgi:hypothetical protein
MEVALIRTLHKVAFDKFASDLTLYSSKHSKTIETLKMFFSSRREDKDVINISRGEPEVSQDLIH